MTATEDEPGLTHATLLRGKINSETAQIPWHELQRYFAAGHTLFVDPDLDLVEVAMQMHEDNAAQVENWLQQGLINPVTTDQAKNWYQQNTLLWACVIKPWVLLQDRD